MSKLKADQEVLLTVDMIYFLMGIENHSNFHFNYIREMQGVPAQLEYLKSDGKRRHPARCIFHDGTGKSRICTNPLSEICHKHCNSAKNCDCYEEQET